MSCILSDDVVPVTEERLRALERLVAVNSDNIHDLRQEEVRTRERLHKLEGGQRAMEHLADIIRNEIAKASARQRDETRQSSGVRAQWLAVGVALGGLLVGLASVLLR